MSKKKGVTRTAKRSTRWVAAALVLAVVGAGIVHLVVRSAEPPGKGGQEAQAEQASPPRPPGGAPALEAKAANPAVPGTSRLGTLDEPAPAESDDNSDLNNRLTPEEAKWLEEHNGAEGLHAALDEATVRMNQPLSPEEAAVAEGEYDRLLNIAFHAAPAPPPTPIDPEQQARIDRYARERQPIEALRGQVPDEELQTRLAALKESIFDAP